LRSSGLHSNGYALVRSLIANWDLDLARPYQEQLQRTLGTSEAADAIAAEPEHALATLGEVFLTPTTIYTGALRAARTTLRDAGHDLLGLAHVTGGGLRANVQRALPEHLGARLDPSTWRVPSVVRLIGALGGLDDEELRATFNAGIGMVAIVSPAAAEGALAALAGEALAPAVIGSVVAVGDGEPRYLEGSLGGSS
jgi:phosphoribosylformylglycinamidine cyclo-ligase